MRSAVEGVERHEAVELAVRRWSRPRSRCAAAARNASPPAGAAGCVPGGLVGGEPSSTPASKPRRGRSGPRSKASSVTRSRAVARAAASERVARQGAADAADVGGLERPEVGGDAFGDRGAHPVGRRGHAAGDRLAERDEVGLQAVGAGVAAGPAQRVGLVDGEQGAVLFGERPERVVVPGSGRMIRCWSSPARRGRRRSPGWPARPRAPRGLPLIAVVVTARSTGGPMLSGRERSRPRPRSRTSSTVPGTPGSRTTPSGGG